MLKSFKTDCLADGHSHLREGNTCFWLLQLASLGGADILFAMPNTENGLKTAKECKDYIESLTKWAEELMVRVVPMVLITENTTNKEIDLCIEAGINHGKVYSRFRTTNSDYGVVRYGRILPQIKHCGEVGMFIHLHCEHPSMVFGNRDAEFSFLPIIQMFLEETETEIIWEHGSDARCIPHWKKFAETGRFSLTLTGHHLASNEDQSYGDIRSVCKPPIKTEYDRLGLVGLVYEGLSWVMAGGDSAYHPREKKHSESGCCACGSLTAPYLLSLYAHSLPRLLWIEEGIEIFRNFTSRNLRKLYKLPASTREVELERVPFEIPSSYSVGLEKGLPFWAGRKIDWRIVQES